MLYCMARQTNEPPKVSGFLTTEQVAARYGMSEWGVRRMVRAGKLPAINTGTDRRRILRFSEAALVKWEKSAAA